MCACRKHHCMIKSYEGFVRYSECLPYNPPHTHSIGEIRMVRSLTCVFLWLACCMPLLAEEIDLTAAKPQNTIQDVSFEMEANNSAASLFSDPGAGCSSCGAASCGSARGCSHNNCSHSCKDYLFGIVAPTDRGFSDFISPMTNPVNFEDPRTLTEARMIYLRQKVPLAAGGGRVNVFAVQIRAALSDRLSVIATKDGFVTSSNPLIDDGWLDVNAGLKYNLYKDYSKQQILSVGATIDIPVGSTRTLQGNGDGEFHLFATGGAQLGDDWHVLSASGFRLPADTSAESQMWYWSNHIDRYLGGGFYVLAEANWYHWMKSGQVGLQGVSGGDLFNFGSRGIAGNDIVTGAIGVKYKPACRDMEIGVAWEAPLSNREDILNNRLTADWIIRY